MRKLFLLFVFLTPFWLNPAQAEESRYAVTLLSSFEPIPDSMLPRNLTDHVYRTKTAVFGRTIYFVRIGFYATAGEAEVVKQRMVSRYPAALVTSVTQEEYLKTTGGKGEPAATAIAPKPSPEPLPPPTPAKPRAPASVPVPPVPVTTLPTPTVPVTGKSAEAAQPVPAPSPAAPAVAAKPAPTTMEEEASKLIQQARDALTAGNNTLAVQLLNKLLKLPPNAQSQDAQELIGLAHERLKERNAALQEYQLYLRLYPEGPGADRVRQRLVALEAPPPRVALKKPERADTGSYSFRGNLSQFYFYGQSQVDSSTVVLGPATESTVSNTDLSTLYNNLDMHLGYSRGNWDNRLVIRESYTASFLDTVDSFNRLYSAYYELNNKANEFSFRIGRQPGSNGGVLGRFDGITAGYSIFPKWRINIVAGEPAEFFNPGYSKQFWGTSLDYGLFANHWNGSIYYIQQMVDGYADRQAIGSELRFFDPKGSALLYADYDTLFGALNIFSFQANWMTGPKTTWNTLLDHRLAPTLMTSNALFGAPSGSTIESLLQTQTEEQLRQLAETKSPTFDTYMLGVTQNLSQVWQIGGDIKRFNLSAAPSDPNISTVLGTGTTMIYTVQTIANGLIRNRDLSVLSFSYLDGSTYQAQTVAFTQRMLFGESWTFDLAVSYQTQQTAPVITFEVPDFHSTTNDSTRLTPLMRLSYLWGKNLSLEAELGVEHTTTHSVNENITVPSAPSITDTDSSRTFYSLGYRWNF